MKTPSVVLCAFLVAAPLSAESLEAILSRMDQASPAFKGMSADVQLTTYTAVISDKSVQNGNLKMQRQKAKNTRAVLDFSSEKDARVVFFSGNIVRFVYPKTKLYQDVDVGKSGVMDQFLLLGFGSSGKELMESYQITTAGTEKVAGQEATKLVLTPKTEKVKERLSKVEVWIPEGAAYPIQQEFFLRPSGDYQIILYTNVKINPSIKGNLEYKLPPGTKKQGS
jgi:outer membrane lipoprotein-sorting protein